jgi:hypothetical protein
MSPYLTKWKSDGGKPLIQLMRVRMNRCENLSSAALAISAQDSEATVLKETSVATHVSQAQAAVGRIHVLCQPTTVLAVWQ